MRAQQIVNIPHMYPAQSSTVTRPSQASVVPLTTPTGAAQFDINSIMGMMIPILIVVMMMKVMTGAIGEGETKPKQIKAS